MSDTKEEQQQPTTETNTQENPTNPETEPEKGSGKIISSRLILSYIIIYLMNF